MLSTITESNFNVPKELLDIQEKVYNNERITDEEAYYFFKKVPSHSLAHLLIIFGKKSTETLLISTVTFILSPLMFAFSPVTFVAIADYMLIVKRAGNFPQSKCCIWLRNMMDSQ
jgi:hypothetical protein